MLQQFRFDSEQWTQFIWQLGGALTHTTDVLSMLERAYKKSALGMVQVGRDGQSG